MRKIILLFISFLCLGVYAQTLTTKVTQTYSWNVSNHSRDMTLSNDTIYVIDKNTKAIHKINALDGSEYTDKMLSDVNFTGYSLTADNTGNLYITSGAYGMTNNLHGTLIVGKTSSYANTTLSHTGVRSDFVEAYGDFKTTGYLAAASINTADNIYVWEINEGTIVEPASPHVFSNTRGGFASGADIKWIDATKLLATGQTKVPAIIELDFENKTASSTPIGTTTYTFGGSAYFELLGTPYVVLPTNGLGSFKIFDITNPVTPVEKATNTTDIGSVANASVHMGLETVVENNKATIYVWSPNNGLAIHEFVIPVKTFTVTVPQGTEKVYIAGSFPNKNWDINDPYELTATENPNEFTGTFPCGDDIEYKYLSDKGDWDYQEASSLGTIEYNATDASPVKPSNANNRTYNEADEVANWVAVSKLILAAKVTSGGIPTDLYVKGGWDGWSNSTALTKSGSDFTVTLGGSIGDKYYSNTGYKYYTTNSGTPENWENRGSNRWAIYPVMLDEISGFNTTLPLTSLDYTESGIRILRSSTGITVTFDGAANIELYNLNGVLIEKMTASASYSRDLPNGAYIIRINGKSIKFVK